MGLERMSKELLRPISSNTQSDLLQPFQGLICVTECNIFYLHIGEVWNAYFSSILSSSSAAAPLLFLPPLPHAFLPHPKLQKAPKNLNCIATLFTFTH
jgi:hypothetical protein